jgi:hypothetical protein
MKPESNLCCVKRYLTGAEYIIVNFAVCKILFSIINWHNRQEKEFSDWRRVDNHSGIKRKR